MNYYVLLTYDLNGVDKDHPAWGDFKKLMFNIWNWFDAKEPNTTLYKTYVLKEKDMDEHLKELIKRDIKDVLHKLDNIKRISYVFQYSNEYKYKKVSLNLNSNEI